MTHEHKHPSDDCDEVVDTDCKPTSHANEYNALRRETNKILDANMAQCSVDQEIQCLISENKVLKARVDQLSSQLATRIFQVNKCHRMIGALNADLRAARKKTDDLRIRKDTYIHHLERHIEDLQNQGLWSFLCRWWKGY